MAEHSYLKMATILLAFLLFIVVIVFNALAGTSNGGGVFQNNTGGISDLFNLLVTPAGWTFTIWAFIYTWQALWLVYALTTLCRRKGGHRKGIDSENIEAKEENADDQHFLLTPQYFLDFIVGVFQNNTGGISDLFNLPVTPAGWTFTIWAFIYTWQALWLVYALTTLCRRKGGTYLYIMPAYSFVTYGAYVLSHICNVAWLFAFDGRKLAIGLPIILLQFITLAIALFFACKCLYENYGSLLKAGLSVDVWLIRMLIQNGIAFYAAWVFVASMLNVGLVMTYKTGDDATDIGVEPDVSGTVVLVLVAIGLITWYILDIFVVDKYSRYIFSPYITLTVAASGIISKNFDLENNNRNSIISVILVTLAALFFVTKVIAIIYRQFKKPIIAEDADYKPTV